MPNLDQLLTDDAERSVAADGAASDLGSALRTTLSRARRRRRGGVTLGAVAALAVAGTVLVATTVSRPASSEHVRLTADYHVLSAVPARPGVAYVFGPSTGRTPAGCERVPHIAVVFKRLPITVTRDDTGRTYRREGIEWIIAPARGYRIPSGLNGSHSGKERTTFHDPFPPLSTLPAGRYGLFTCRTG